MMKKLGIQQSKTATTDWRVEDTTVPPEIAISDGGPSMCCIGKGVWLTCAHGAPGWHDTEKVNPGATTMPDGTRFQALRSMTGKTVRHPRWFRPEDGYYTHPDQWTYDMLLILTPHHPELDEGRRFRPNFETPFKGQCKIIGYPATEYTGGKPTMFANWAHVTKDWPSISYRPGSSESGYSGAPLVTDKNLVHGVLSTGEDASSLRFLASWARPIIEQHEAQVATIAPVDNLAQCCRWLDRSNWDVAPGVETVGKLGYSLPGGGFSFGWATTKVPQTVNSRTRVTAKLEWDAPAGVPTIRLRANRVVNGRWTGEFICSGHADFAPPPETASIVLEKGQWLFSVDVYGQVASKVTVRSLSVE